jgi:hypothetical protein
LRSVLLQPHHMRQSPRSNIKKPHALKTLPAYKRFFMQQEAMPLQQFP